MPGSELTLPSSRSVEPQCIHPCEFIQRSASEQDEALRLHQLRCTQGTGPAIELARTEYMLRARGRPGALPCSNVLYHSARGSLTRITPDDLYGCVENDPQMQPMPHTLTEQAVYGYELNMKNMGFEAFSTE